MENKVLYFVCSFWQEDGSFYSFDVFEGIPVYYDEIHGFLGHPITFPDGLRIVSSLGFDGTFQFVPNSRKDVKPFRRLFGDQEVTMQFFDTVEDVMKHLKEYFNCLATVSNAAWFLGLEEDAVPQQDGYPSVRLHRQDGTVSEIGDGFDWDWPDSGEPGDDGCVSRCDCTYL